MLHSSKILPLSKVFSYTVFRRQAINIVTQWPKLGGFLELLEGFISFWFNGTPQKNGFHVYRSVSA